LIYPRPGPAKSVYEYTAWFAVMPAAFKVIELANAGERNPERWCDGVLHEFRAPPPHA